MMHQPTSIEQNESENESKKQIVNESEELIPNDSE